MQFLLRVKSTDTSPCLLQYQQRRRDELCKQAHVQRFEHHFAEAWRPTRGTTVRAGACKLARTGLEMWQRRGCIICCCARAITGVAKNGKPQEIIRHLIVRPRRTASAASQLSFQIIGVRLLWRIYRRIYATAQ